MRQRLSWDKEKAAEIMKQADPYTMNQTRQNPPASKYQTGDPSAWAEDQNKETPWKSEGRTETGHPAPAREAVVQARKLEDKALKCVTIAQRMLPGADETTLEDMATDLMFMPERAVLATLQRQSELAAKIAADQPPSGEYSPKKKKPTTDKPKSDKPNPEGEEGQEEGQEVEAKKEEKKPEEDKPILEAKKVEKKPEEDKPILEAKKEEKKPEEDKPILEAKKKPEEMACDKEASDKDLLDILFDNSDITAASETPKVGAKKLSGIVKQASGENPLDNLWDAPPDVSAAFK